MKRKTKSEREKYLFNLKMRSVKVHVIQLAILIGFFAIWELLAKTQVIDDFITSSPSRIAKMLKELLKSDIFMHIGTTMYECLIGFAIATIGGSLVAVILWWSETTRRVLEPYLVILNSLPKIALGPVIIIWVGAGAKAIIMMTVLICVVVTIISVLNGFMECSQSKILLLRSMGASKLQILIKLILPNSLPNFMSVIKINVGLSWVGAIMGEYLVSSAGLGYLIIYGGQVFKLDLVMASTLILCILAALMYICVAIIEKRLCRFR